MAVRHRTLVHSSTCMVDLPSRPALHSPNTSLQIRRYVSVDTFQPQSNRSTVGDRVFPVAGLQVWNSLPPKVTSAPSLDTFRRRLIAHLFTVSCSFITTELTVVSGPCRKPSLRGHFKNS